MLTRTVQLVDSYLTAGGNVETPVIWLVRHNCKTRYPPEIVVSRIGWMATVTLLLADNHRFKTGDEPGSIDLPTYFGAGADLSAAQRR